MRGEGNKIDIRKVLRGRYAIDSERHLIEKTQVIRNETVRTKGGENPQMFHHLGKSLGG